MTHTEGGHEYPEVVVQTLQNAGVKLICIDFDATFLSIHTGGQWTQSAQVLSDHVRPLFLTLIPTLVAEANLHVAIVTFSPQRELVWDVLRICFQHKITQKLIVRCDDSSWTPVPLTDRSLVEFGPQWQLCGMHVDRKYKLPYVISAAVQASQSQGLQIRNRETVLIDDDPVTIRIAIDNGITGVYFDPDCADTETLCKQIQKLHQPVHEFALNADVPRSPGPQILTPCKRTQVRLLSTPEACQRPLSATHCDNTQKTPCMTRMSRKKKVTLCTPSPIMKFKSTVDMGRPKSKRATRLQQSTRKINNDLREFHFMGNLTTPGSMRENIGFLLQPSFKLSPSHSRDATTSNRLLGSMFSLQEIDFD